MSTDEWNVSALDLPAYLDRLAFGDATEPTLATLTGLHRAQVAAITFENLDVILGRGVSVELPDIAAKLVDQARGGYCYDMACCLRRPCSRSVSPSTDCWLGSGRFDPTPSTHAFRLDSDNWRFAMARRRRLRIRPP